MKKKKTTLIILAVAVFSAFIAGVTSILYYVPQDYGVLATLALVLRNIITCFAFVPSLSVTDILKWLNETDTVIEICGWNLTSLEYLLTQVYAAIILIAPICTAGALYVFVLRILRQIKWRIVPFFWKAPKEKIMIIGSGHAAASLILSEDENDDNREIYYISSKPKTVDEEVKLLKKKIRYSQDDLINCTDQELSQFIKKYKLDTMDAIILCEDSDAANFSIYIRLMKCGYEELSKDCQICCKCEEPSLVHLVSDYYNDNKTECLPPKIFSIAKMRVNSILAKQALPIPEHCDEISFLVVGFGKTGQTMVKNMMNLGVTNASSKLNIHVVDLDMGNKAELFKRYFSPEYFDITEDRCSISSAHADGELNIIFHNIDIRRREFELLLQEHDFQYVSVCMENVDYCLDCMQTLEEYALKNDKQTMPIVISLMSDPEITVYLNQDIKRYKNVIFIGVSTFYNIDQILMVSTEREAKRFHHLYQNMSVVTLKEYQDKLQKSEEKQDTPWETTLYYKQEASRQLSQHQIVKNKVLEYMKAQDKDFSIDTYFGENGTILQKKGNDYIFDFSAEELVARLNADPRTKELGALEHRRWCYCQAEAGWSYGPKKIESLKVTPYLVTWDRLSAEHPGVCIYDYMAYLLEDEGER